MMNLEAVHYLERTYATSDVINEAVNAVRCLCQYRFIVQEYADRLAERVLKYKKVFDDNELMGIFVEGLKD